MLHNVFRISTIVAASLLIYACAQPVHNVREAPIEVPKPDYTLDDVASAITRAGTGLGWVVRHQTPGHGVATLHLRSHMAQVDITYTLDSYNIEYRGSENLDYDGTNIHRNYNGWIQNLNNAIQVQLSTL